jgi:hypothetical protein
LLLKGLLCTPSDTTTQHDTQKALPRGIQSWHGSWRDTYLAHFARGRYAPGAHRRVSARGLYSDALYAPWRCATVEPRPEWLETETVER